MLTQLYLRNFKRFREVAIELGSPVVFIGPNNSGKTTALQALALWELGLKRWLEKRGEKTPEKRPGVTLNRRDLLGVPVPTAHLLWRDLHVRDTRRVDGRNQTENVRLEVRVDGATEGRAWQCGLEFDLANEESIYCRPLRTGDGKDPERMAIPEEAKNVRVAFLPPMSGLAANETRLDAGAINVRLGEGRTAEVLRNLCHRVYSEDRGGWDKLAGRMRQLFHVTLDPPVYIPERGELEMSYHDPAGVRLDLSAAGRGLQQTLLLLSHLALNPRSVLLIDEPDAHLEILRQRQIYQILADAARDAEGQIVMASHSEVILNEAADRDVVVAFVGRPHRIDDRGSQLVKSLKEIGFDQYYQADQTGWVLYLEGSTDLAILRALAEVLDHPAIQALERPFVHYVQNQPAKARDHFYGLREARRDLVGFALFDRLELTLDPNPHLEQRMWHRREMESYLAERETLLRWARAEGERQLGPLFGGEWEERMAESIAEIEKALTVLGQSPWSGDLKVSDQFFKPLFERFYKSLGLPNLLQKTDYHVLACHVRREDVAPEVAEVLDRIQAVAESARPGDAGA